MRPSAVASNFRQTPAQGGMRARLSMPRMRGETRTTPDQKCASCGGGLTGRKTIVETRSLLEFIVSSTFFSTNLGAGSDAG